MFRLVLCALLTLGACSRPNAASPAGDAATLAESVDERPAARAGGSCASAGECVAVGCACGCTGGVGLREAAVPAAEEARWYRERGCSQPSSCATAPCPPARLDCIGGSCHLVFGEAPSVAGGAQGP